MTKRNSKVFWQEGCNTAESQTILGEMKNIIGKTKLRNFNLFAPYWLLMRTGIYGMLGRPGRRKGALRKSSGANLMAQEGRLVPPLAASLQSVPLQICLCRHVWSSLLAARNG